MSSIRYATAILLAASCALPDVAQGALSQRTFVKSTGSDANMALGCSLLSPCRSFSAAMTQTNPGGEVIVLDSAGYGPVTIAQSVSIIAPAGIYAGVSVLGAPNPDVGVTINGAATDVVTLRGLAINSLGGTTGILFNSGKSLIVGRTVVSGFANGIIHNANGSAFVADTQIVNGATAFSAAGPAGGIAEYVLERVSIDSMTAAGVLAADRTLGALRNAVVSNVHNTANTAGRAIAVEALLQNGSSAIVTCDQCNVQGSYTGFYAGAMVNGNAVIRVTRSSSTANVNGFLKAALGGGEDIRSVKNNFEDGNVNAPSAATAVTAY